MNHSWLMEGGRRKMNTTKYRKIAWYFAGILQMIFFPVWAARTIRVTNVTELKNVLNQVIPGDTILLASGVYQSGNLNLTDIAGTESEPIVLEGEGNAVIRGTSYGANVIEIRNCHHLVLRNLEITSTTVPESGIDGIKLQGNPSDHITFDRLYIHHVSGTGITVFCQQAHHLVLRNCEIAHCSFSGLYWGYPGRDIVRDTLIQHNYIHHCPDQATMSTNYGIQLKGWSYRVRIEDNVLHDVGGTTRCGLIVYYGRTPLQGDVPEDMNIVRGNVLWNCRSEGINAMSDALVENNIVFDAGYGIMLQTYDDESFVGPNFVENLVVRNNTVFRCRTRCINISGWGNAGANVSFSGNVAYQDYANRVAIGGSVGTAQAAGNLYFGTSSITNGTVAGNGLGDFLSVTAQAAVPQLDFYPSAGSPLSDHASLGSGTDFNHTPRPYNSNYDSGAYEWTGSANPGWHIAEDFKGTGLQFQTISLVAGWNWISFNILPADLTLDSVFGQVLGQVEQVKIQTQSTLRLNGQWVGDLQNMNGIQSGMMFKVRVSTPCTLTVSGTRIASATPITLQAGWNWVAFFPSTIHPINSALASISGHVQQVKSQVQSAIYQWGDWVGDLQNLEPGRGYAILMSQAVMLVYPNG